MKKTCITIFAFLLVYVCVDELCKAYGVYAENPPYSRKVTLNKEGVYIDDYFEVNRPCAYSIDFYIDHKLGVFDEYKGVLSGGNLPVNVELMVGNVKDKNDENVFIFSGWPKIRGRSVNFTQLNVGYVLLRSGRYRIRLNVSDHLLVLDDIDFSLNVGRVPDSICHSRYWWK